MSSKDVKKVKVRLSSVDIAPEKNISLRNVVILVEIPAECQYFVARVITEFVVLL